MLLEFMELERSNQRCFIDKVGLNMSLQDRKKLERKLELGEKKDKQKEGGRNKQYFSTQIHSQSLHYFLGPRLPPKEGL